MKSSLWLGAMCALIVVAGCSGMKQPATQTVAAAEAALGAIKENAAKYAPDALHSVEAQIASLKDSLAKGDYKAVMAAGPKVTAAIGDLSSTVKAKQAEIEAAAAEAAEKWNSLGGDVPKMLEAIQSRVDILSKAKRLPKNLDKAAFASAKTGLDSLKASWAEAGSSFSSGNVADAVAKAQSVKDKGTEIMRTLGMTGT